jgi:hypothetical protein
MHVASTLCSYLIQSCSWITTLFVLLIKLHRRRFSRRIKTDSLIYARTRSGSHKNGLPNLRAAPGVRNIRSGWATPACRPETSKHVRSFARSIASFFFPFPHESTTVFLLYKGKSIKRRTDPTDVNQKKVRKSSPSLTDP